MCHALLILSSILGHLSATANTTVKDTGTRIPVRAPAFNSSGSKPRSGMAGSYANSSFNFLRNRHTDFHHGGTIFHIVHSHGVCFI